MLRKLLLLGVFVGSSASIPIVYQSNPQMVETLLRSAVASKPAAPEAQPDVNLASVPA
ncbi:MAG: TIGR02281 family clan AA aspartic protease, partial [Mesorhizobium sp.]